MARVFNGSTQYLTNTSFASASFPVTLVAWFQTTSIAASAFRRVVTWMDSGANTIASILLNYPNGGDVANQVYNGPTNALPFKSGMSANTWHHAAVVSTSSGCTVYLDGVQGSTVSYSNPSFSSVNRLHIGYIPSTQYLGGRSAFAAAYSAELTADEILALGQKLNGVPCGVHPTRIRPESLVACWPLGGFDGDHDGDIWANAYNLTAYNSPTWDEGPAVMYSVPPQIIYPASAGGGGGGSPLTSWWAWNQFGTPLDHGARN